MRGRRRRGKKRYQRYQSRNKTKLTFTPVIVILCLSVGCGYATAKYVVDPVVNYVPQMTAENERNDEIKNDRADSGSGNAEEKSTKTDVIEDEVSVEEKGKITGYALQFGCYSGKAAAESVIPTIGVDGLQVIEQNDMYKIVGTIYKTKAEAKAALGKLPESVSSFVTAIYE